MHDIELKQISVFIAVRELGGLTAAQERLGMSCSAISKSLADLEMRVGCKLCHRGRSGFRITQEGERFYHAASKLQESLQGFKLDIGNIKNEKVLLIRIGVVDATLNDVNNPLPEILKQLQKQHKHLEFKIHVSSSIDIADMLLANKLDMGLTYQQGLRVPLKAIPLYKEELIFVIGKEHYQKQSILVVSNEEIPGIETISKPILRSALTRFGLASFIHQQEFAELFGAVELKQNMSKEQLVLDSVEYQPIKYEQVSNIEEILWRASTSTSIGLVPRHLISESLSKSLYCFRAECGLYTPMYAVYRHESYFSLKNRDDVFNELLTLLARHHHAH